MIKTTNVLFTFDDNGRSFRVLFEPLAARQWQVTLSTDDGSRPPKTIQPRPNVSCWPCVTHATSLARDYLAGGNSLADWAAEQHQRVHGEPSERPALKVARDE